MRIVRKCNTSFWFFFKSTFGVILCYTSVRKRTFDKVCGASSSCWRQVLSISHSLTHFVTYDTNSKQCKKNKETFFRLIKCVESGLKNKLFRDTENLWSKNATFSLLHNHEKGHIFCTYYNKNNLRNRIQPSMKSFILGFGI